MNTGSWFFPNPLQIIRVFAVYDILVHFDIYPKHLEIMLFPKSINYAAFQQKEQSIEKTTKARNAVSFNSNEA